MNRLSNALLKTRKWFSEPIEDEFDWDRPGRLARLKSKLGPFLWVLVSFGLVIFGFVVYFLQVIPSMHRNGVILLVSLVLLAFVLGVLFGRNQILAMFRRLEVHVQYMGQSGAVRLGKTVSENGVLLFQAIKRVGWGGFRVEWESLREKVPAPEAPEQTNKYQRFEKSNDPRANYEVSRTHTKVRTDDALPLGDAYIDHIGGTEVNANSKDVDISTSLAPVIDERDSSDISALLSGQARKLERQDRIIDALEDRIDGVLRLLDDAEQRKSKEIIGLLRELRATKNSMERDVDDLDALDEQAAENAEKRLNK